MILGEHPEDAVVVLDKLPYAGNPRNLGSVRSAVRCGSESAGRKPVRRNLDLKNLGVGPAPLGHRHNTARAHRKPPPCRIPLMIFALNLIASAVETRSGRSRRRGVQQFGPESAVRLRGQDVRFSSPYADHALIPRGGVRGAASWHYPDRCARAPRVARRSRARGAPSLRWSGDPRHLREWASQPGRRVPTLARWVRDGRERARRHRRLAAGRAADRPLTLSRSHAGRTCRPSGRPALPG